MAEEIRSWRGFGILLSSGADSHHPQIGSRATGYSIVQWVE